MTIKIGISPIAWQNDDLPELTAAYTMEQALQESREIGYTGVERGQRMPKDTDGLKAYLDKYDIVLCGGWCSGHSLVLDFADETAAISGQVEQFKALDAPCIVYAECSNTVQGEISTPVNNRPTLSRDEIRDYAHRVSEIAKWSVDQGMPVAYHHHMGSIIEAEEDVNWLMEYSDPGALKLTFDTGHPLFGGGDVLATLTAGATCTRALQGYPPGRGRRCACQQLLDAAPLHTVHGRLHRLPRRRHGPQGYGLQRLDRLEADQDPAKALPMEYSQMGYNHIIEVLDASGLSTA